MNVVIVQPRDGSEGEAGVWGSSETRGDFDRNEGLQELAKPTYVADCLYFVQNIPCSWYEKYVGLTR